MTSTSLKEIIAPRHDDSGRKLMEVAELVDLLMPEVWRLCFQECKRLEKHSNPKTI